MFENERASLLFFCTTNICEMRAKAQRELHEWQNPVIPPTPPPKDNTTHGKHVCPEQIKDMQRNWRGQVEFDFASRANLSTNKVTYKTPAKMKKKNKCIFTLNLSRRLNIVETIDRFRVVFL